MDDDLVFSESEKPRYLLPEGCKDLFDVIVQQEQTAEILRQKAAISEALEKLTSKASLDSMSMLAAYYAAAEEKQSAAPFQKLPLYITIPDPVSVTDLATLLQLKPYQMIAILIKVDCFASVKSEISFDTAFMACARLGVEAKKAEEP